MYPNEHTRIKLGLEYSVRVTATLLLVLTNFFKDGYTNLHFQKQRVRFALVPCLSNAGYCQFKLT